MPAPTALDDLNEAERFLVAAVARGEPVDMKRNVVRAQVLRDLLLETRPGWALPPAGLRLQRAIIDGGLDLEGCTLAKPFLVWHSRFQGGGDRGAILIRDAKLKRLGIHSSTVDGAIVADRVEIENGLFLGGGLVRGAVQVRGGDIGGALGIEGTTIGDGKQALLAAGLRLTGPLLLRRAEVKGQVAVPRAVLGSGLYLEGAKIQCEGIALNAESGRIDGDVLIDRAAISGAVRLAGARVGGHVSGEGAVIAATPEALMASGLVVTQGINLSGARIAGAITLEGAEIGKMFRADGIEVWSGASAIAADVIRIGGNWDLSRARITGHLAFPGAEINGQLRLTEARILGHDLAIRADGSRIRGGCFLSRATIAGLVRLPACEVGNQLRLRGASLKVEQGAALLASGSRFQRDVELDGLGTTGALVFDQSIIGGMVDLSGSKIVSVALAGAAPAPSPMASAADGAGDGNKAPASGASAWNETALSFVDARIDRLTMPSKADERPRGIVDLSRAHAGAFLDYAAAWPPPPPFRGRSPDLRDIDHLVLDGFTCEHLTNPAGVERLGLEHSGQAGARRVVWLESQREEDLSSHFKPQIWVELAQRLSAQGHLDDARAVTIARLRRERRSRSMSTGQRWQSRILDLFALYGYNPWRTVAWMSVLVLLFAGVWSLAASRCETTGCFDESVFAITNRDAYTPAKLDGAYPPFNALAYSFDVFVPFVPFGYEDHWRPNISWRPLVTLAIPDWLSGGAAEALGLGDRPGGQPRTLTLTLGGVLYVLMVIETLIGLVLTSLVVTGFTGLLRSEE